jgi:6-phospho-3-hexuloisomerase
MARFAELATAVIGELETTLAGISEERAEALVQEIEKAEHIFIAGAGRSGLMARAFCMRLMHLGLNCYVAGETVTPAFAQGDLLLVASGSGSTESLVVMAQKAKQQIRGRLALITIDGDSPIARLADVTLVVPAPSPKIKRPLVHDSIQPMGSLFEQSLLLTLDLLILLFMQQNGIEPSAMFDRHANLE